MPETLEIRSLSGVITLGIGNEARVFIPRFEFRGCTPPVPVIPGPPPLEFLTPYSQEIIQFLQWLNGFTPKLSHGSTKPCVAAFEPFLNKETKAFHHPASFGSLSLKDDFSYVFKGDNKNDKKDDKKTQPIITQIGRIGYRVAASRVIGKYFSCEKTLQERLKPFNGEVTDESLRIISEYSYSLGSDFTHEDFQNLYEGVSQFLYLDRNGSSFAHSFMEKFSEALGNNKERTIFTPENFGCKTLLHSYLMWSVVELASAIIILLVFGELELAKKLQALIQTYESSVWPLCLLEHRHDENKQPHSTTILLLCS